MQNWQIQVHKGTKVRVRADFLKLGPQTLELGRDQESGYRLEDPEVSRGQRVRRINMGTGTWPWAYSMGREWAFNAVRMSSL